MTMPAESDAEGQGMPVFESMQQCVARTGIPLAILKHAKRNGCPAFRYHRVSLAPLLKWIFSERADAIPNIAVLQARQLQLQNEILKSKLAVVRREFVAISDVERWGRELGDAVKKKVLQIHQMAHTLEGLEVADISKKLRDVEYEILSQLSSIDEKVSEATTQAKAFADDVKINGDANEMQELFATPTLPQTSPETDAS